jgi:hypothetical protein
VDVVIFLVEVLIAVLDQAVSALLLCEGWAKNMEPRWVSFGVMFLLCWSIPPEWQDAPSSPFQWIWCRSSKRRD